MPREFFISANLSRKTGAAGNLTGVSRYRTTGTGFVALHCNANSGFEFVIRHSDSLHYITALDSTTCHPASVARRVGHRTTPPRGPDRPTGVPHHAHTAAVLNGFPHMRHALDSMCICVCVSRERLTDPRAGSLQKETYNTHTIYEL